MSEVKGVIKKSTAQAICDAVKTVEGSVEPIPFSAVAEKIAALENKLPQVVDKTITELSNSALNGATKIGDYAFYNCTNLTTINIPDTITTVEKYGFAFCNKLELDDIPPQLTTIEEGAFKNCRKLKKITVPGTVTNLGKEAFYYCNGATEIDIKPGVEIIGENAFWNCHGASKVTIPNTVTSIGASAFAYNYNILFNYLAIPNSVTSLGESTFDYCQNLTSLFIGNGVTTLPTRFISSCSSIEQISIGNSVAIISANAFTSTANPKLTTVIFPASVTQFEDSFYAGSTENKATLIFLGTVPPTKEYACIHRNFTQKIIVPAGCGDAYRNATNWANISDLIEEAENGSDEFVISDDTGDKSYYTASTGPTWGDWCVSPSNVDRFIYDKEGNIRYGNKSVYNEDGSLVNKTEEIMPGHNYRLV